MPGFFIFWYILKFSIVNHLVKLKRMKCTLKTITATLVALLTIPVSMPVKAEETTPSLRILFTGDLNAMIDPTESYDVENETYVSTGGYAKLATLIKEYETENSLLLDAGGFSAGSSYDVIFDENPSLQLMKEMGYDAYTPGDEEFIYGYDAMLKSIGSVGEGPAAVASWFDAEGIETTKIFEVEGVKVGVFGVVSDAVLDYLDEDDRYQVKHDSEAADEAVTKLQNEGADYIICLYHDMMKEGSDTRAAQNLVKASDGIDLVITAESVDELSSAQQVDDTWIVSSGAFGTKLGVMDIDPKTNQLLMHTIVEGSAETEGDEAIGKSIQSLQKKRNDKLNERDMKENTVIAHTDHSLGKPSDYTYESGNVSGTESFAADAIASAWNMQEGGNTNAISILPRDTFHREIVRGDITNRDIADMMQLGKTKEDDRLIGTYMRGADLVTLCETDHTLGSVNPAYRFVFGNMQYHYQDSRMPYNRISSIRVQEIPGYWANFSDDMLYPVVMTKEAARRLLKVQDVTNGQLAIAFYSEKGTEITGLVEDDFLKERSGKEITIGSAIEDYVSTFSRNGNKRHDISSAFTDHARARVADDLSFTSFFSHTTDYAWKKYIDIGLGIVAIIIVCKLVMTIIRRVVPSMRHEKF